MNDLDGRPRVPTAEPWPGEWTRPLIEVCVLRCIADGPTYGYAIGLAIGQAGLGNLKGGTLYPLLARLEQAELVRSHWAAGDGGPGRKFYELTPAGQAHLSELVAAWGQFSLAVGDFVETEPHAEPHVIGGRGIAGASPGEDQKGRQRG